MSLVGGIRLRLRTLTEGKYRILSSHITVSRNITTGSSDRS